MSFPNIYTHRRVADTSARSCDICYKQTSSVLITPDNKDFFYICPAHLKDKNFCTPKVDKAAEEARKKKEMEDEMERVKEEYEEKQRKKKEKSKDKSKEKDEKSDKDTKEKEKEKDAKAGDEGKDKTDADNAKEGAKSASEGKDEAGSPPAEGEPRVFELKSTFYQQRLNKKRQAEMAKRNRERMGDPSFFPSVPKGQP
ncbi:DUF1742-domain-containing protein [Thozetella sp. PMI_491]|nr:DUF1742-domain-containing protein [Thozetella sp. PMI_491]